MAVTHGGNVLTSSRIKNPLAGIPRDKLLRQVTEFAEQNYLSDITPLLQKGAMVAQNPSDWENVPGLTEEEKSALDAEVTHKWRQPRAMYMTVILCSIGAAVQYVSCVTRDAVRMQLTSIQRLGSNWIQWRELVVAC